MSRYGLWEIYEHLDEELQLKTRIFWINIGTKWLPMDPSIFFSYSKEQVSIWDSNSGGLIFNDYNICDSKFIEPHIGLNEVILIGGENGLIVQNYNSWDCVGKINDRILSAKWSPYRDDYFVTGGVDYIKVWDLRRILTPVYCCGHLDSSQPRKKIKTGGPKNVYDDFFIWQKEKKTLDKPCYSLEFSKDGRFLYSKTYSEIWKYDLLNAESLPSLQTLLFSKSKTSIFSRSETGFFSSKGNSLIKYFDNFEPKQCIELESAPIGLAEIRQGDYLYILEKSGNIDRFITSI